MFPRFRQNGVDRTGLGLGLSIARRSVEASAGTLSVRDIPAISCVFTISLPRYAVLDQPRRRRSISVCSNGQLAGANAAADRRRI
ncbi:MAG: hypothetical protein WDN30_08185 [Pararobbsia sp.]